MATLSELTVQVITARLAKRDMSLEELENEMKVISKHLQAIENGTNLDPVSEAPIEESVPQKINLKQIFKKDEVICLICNKGFKTLKKHLTQAHQITDKEYKAQFNIPAKQALVAKSYSDQKKAFALENKLGDKMQAGRKAKTVVASGELFEAAVPAIKVKAIVPAVKKKAPAPVVKEKATVPAKVTKKK